MAAGHNLSQLDWSRSKWPVACHPSYSSLSPFTVIVQSKACKNFSCHLIGLKIVLLNPSHKTLYNPCFLYGAFSLLFLHHSIFNMTDTNETLLDLDALEAEADSHMVTTTTTTSVGVDDEIEEMKRRVAEMEEEALKLTEMQNVVESQLGSAATPSIDPSDTSALDETSIYVGQVDYEATPEELQALFQSCGTINRVTIMCDRYTGQPKGFAYIEFSSVDAVESAVLLNETEFRGRALKVTPKRQNVMGFNARGRGRGGRRGGRGRGRGRGFPRGGRGGRGRGFHPYY